MFIHILKQMQEKIRNGQYVMTLHAAEEMEDDDLTIFDVESVMLTGEIFERQKDRLTADWKYLIKGQIKHQDTVVVAKLSITGKLVIITVYIE